MIRPSLVFHKTSQVVFQDFSSTICGVFHDFPAPCTACNRTVTRPDPAKIVDLVTCDPKSRFQHWRVEVQVFLTQSSNQNRRVKKLSMTRNKEHVMQRFLNSTKYRTWATKILHCLAIIQRDHWKICHTSYSHFHDFQGPRPDSSTFRAWKMWLTFQVFPKSVRTLPNEMQSCSTLVYSAYLGFLRLLLLLMKHFRLYPGKFIVIWLWTEDQRIVQFLHSTI